MQADRRWQALVLTVIAVTGGGLLINWSGRLTANRVDTDNGTRAEVVMPAATDLPAASSSGIQAAPDAVLPHFQAAVALLHTRDFAGAVSALETVLTLQPGMPEAHVNMGFALLGLEQYDRAGSYFEQALELRGSQVNALYGLAVAYEGAGRLEEALGAMKSFLHLLPADDPFRRKAMSAVWEWQEQLDRRARVRSAVDPPEG